MTRIIPYIDKKQISLLYNSFFKGELSYYPLIWTFCSRRSNNLINKLQERALRVVYNDYGSSFTKPLEIANENTVHIKNIHILMTEIYKFLNGLSPPIMSKIFLKGNYMGKWGKVWDFLRNPRSLITNCKSTVKYGIDSIE